MLTNTQLRKIIAGTPVGNSWPFAGGTEAQIEGFLQRVAADLGRSARLEIEAEWQHYGSGYASYVHLFCFKKNAASATQRGNTEWMDGIAVYLCRLAPIAVYGAEQRTKHATGGSSGFLEAESLYELPPGDWQQEAREIEQKLGALGWELPGKKALNAPLPFEATIPTVFAHPPYCLFDALFRWED